MKCTTCGTNNPDDALYCSSCGGKFIASDSAAETSPVFNYDEEKKEEVRQETAQSFPVYTPVNTTPAPTTYTTYQMPNSPQLLGDRSKDWAGITSLVCGILGVICCIFGPVGLLFAVLGVIFGIIGLKSTKRTLAIVGLCLGGVGTLLGIYMTIAYVMVADDPDFMNTYNEIMEEYYASL